MRQWHNVIFYNNFGPNFHICSSCSFSPRYLDFIYMPYIHCVYKSFRFYKTSKCCTHSIYSLTLSFEKGSFKLDVTDLPELSYFLSPYNNNSLLLLLSILSFFFYCKYLDLESMWFIADRIGRDWCSRVRNPLRLWGKVSGGVKKRLQNVMIK